MSGVAIGMLFASFSLAQLIFAPVWGRFSDRVGRKPVIIISLFGTAAGSLLTGLAGSVAVLFAGRIIDGISGASVSVAQAAVADVAPEERRAGLLGMLAAAFGVGFVAGPAIGSLAALGGTHVPFFVAAGISFVNALVALRRLPETKPTDVETDLDEAATRQMARPFLAGKLGRLSGSPLSQTPKDLRRVIVRLIILAFVGMVAFSGFEATFALLAEHRFGLTTSSTAAVFAVIGIAMVVVQGGLVGPVATRLGESTTLRVGLTANVIGLFGLSVDGGWVLLVPSLALLVVGQGLLTPTLTSAVAGRAGSARGVWLGWQQSAGGVARVIGPILAGALFQHVGLGAPYFVGGLLAAVALAIVPLGFQGTDR